MTKEERFADNTRRNAIVNRKLKRREKALHNYLNSAKAKRLRKAVSDAIDEINVLVFEWNNIVLEDNPHFKKKEQ